MSDLKHVSTLFLIFALALFLYGQALARSGNKDLMPLHTRPSLRGPEDIKRAGRIVSIVGLIVGAVALLGYLAVR